MSDVVVKASSSSSALPEEKAFFDLVGPALEDEPLVFCYQDRQYRFGSQTDSVVVRINEADFFHRVLTQGNLGLGECYMSRKFDIVNGRLEQLLISLARSNVEASIRRHPARVAKFSWIYLHNLLRGRYANVQSHYDIGDDLFDSFLDDSLTYSCGYQRSENDTLAELQDNKFDRICRKLRLEKGDELLDIGCGFGGLLIHAAKHYGARGVGITISCHHFRRGRAAVEAQGLSGDIEIQFASHKELPGKFDKIVSVGMMEHLKRSDYGVYVRNIKNSLVQEGLGLIHCIGCNNYKNRHDPFIQKYIFPGSSQPRLSEISRYLEEHSLAILDVENMARHYAPTLRRWNENFQNNYLRLDHRKYDDTFKRMWEYYLACGIAAATSSDSALYQVLFSNGYDIDMPYQRV
jgi:cyclopropane-fatty-acyl-phospholipid synthase